MGWAQNRSGHFLSLYLTFTAPLRAQPHLPAHKRFPEREDEEKKHGSWVNTEFQQGGKVRDDPVKNTFCCFGKIEKV